MPKRSEPIEQPAGDWRTTLADAAQRTQEIRRESVVGEVKRWREVCQGIADGREPDGKTLAEIAEIADRLSLPVNALADDVAALVELKRLAEKAAKKQTERESLEAQAPELKAALATARQEVERTTLLLRRIDVLVSSEAGAGISTQRLKAANPRLFADADHAADAILVERSRVSLQPISTGALA